MRKGQKREEKTNTYRRMMGDAKMMIRTESGMSEIDRAFRSVTKAKHSSPVINYYRKLKVERDRTKTRV